MKGGLRRFSANRAAVASAVTVALVVAGCIVWPLVSPYDANAVDFTERFQPPSLEHPLGTDAFGRDLLTRMAEGGRYSLAVAAGASLLILLVGFLYGAAAGLGGPRADSVLMRLLDGLFALPRLPFYVVVLSLVGLGANIGILIVALAAVSWLTTARLVRGQIQQVRGLDFYRAAEALGARRVRLLRRHVWPNVLGVLLVAVLLELPAILLGEAFVSVLGLGANPPQATWGTIAQDGQTWGRLYEILLPSAAIVLFAVCAHFVADGVNDALDPRREPHRRPVRHAAGAVGATVRRATVG